MLYRSGKPRSYAVTPTRRKICKPLVRSNYRSFATTTMKNHSAKAVLTVLGQMLQKEVASLCSTKFKSVLAQSPKNILVDFSGMVNRFICEMEARAPTLLWLLRWTLKTRQARGNTNLIIAIITSMMCKHRKASVCQLQRIVSLVLYTGHSSKQVFII